MTFNATDHTYSHLGRSYPSVTQILKALRLEPPYPEDTNGARELGTAAHKATELAAWNKLDTNKTSPVLMEYVAGFLEKAREMNIRPIASELRGIHLIDAYAGTLDLLCRVFDGEIAIIDYKTGQVARSCELQTAGYAELALYLESLKPQALFTRANMPRRFSMQLTPRRAIVREYQDTHDFAAWRGAVALYKWQTEKRSVSIETL